MSRFAHTLFFAALLGSTAAVACGGRSPLGSLAYENGPAGGATTTADGGNGGYGATGAAGSGAGVGGEGAGGEGTGGFGPLDCMTCIGQQCPQMLDCLLDPTCLQGLGCSVLNCLGGGSPDLECVGDCFGGDMGAAMNALMGIMCISDTCGDPCQGLIPIPLP